MTQAEKLEIIKKQEERVICRALRDSNYPKITREDLPIFQGLINDLFPGVEVDRLKNEAFERDIKTATEKRGLIPEESFILKIIQFHELLPIRHSIFILGNAAVGKTEVWSTLVDTYRMQKEEVLKKIQYQVINPKAVSTKELFGYISQATREWKDGIFSTVMRNFASMQDKNKKWLLLDGDVDTLWIESLNTVMDDNKILTLASNERIPLHAHMRLIFEIGSLKYASPATVSRAGIIYVNETDVGYSAFFQAWNKKFLTNPDYNIQPRKQSEETAIYKFSNVLNVFLSVLEGRYVKPCLDLLRTKKDEGYLIKTVVPFNDMMVVKSLTRILQVLLDEYIESPAFKINCANAQLNLAAQQAGQQNVADDYTKEVIEHFFLFAAVWAFGGIVSKDTQQDSKDKFNTMFKSDITKAPNLQFPPDKSSVFDYFVDINQETGKPSFILWSSKVKSYVHDPDVPISQVYVETSDSYKLHYFLDKLVPAKYSIMFAGPAGLGKSVLLKSKLRQMEDKFAYATIAMNYYTNSIQLQMIMETYLDKKIGRIFGPKQAGKNLIYMIDDFNMPLVDEYGTQQPITFIRQHQDWNFWFDREKLTPKEIQDVQYVVTMNPTSGSFTINPQNQTQFITFSIDTPNDETLNQIYGQIFTQHLQQDNAKFKTEVQNIGTQIVKTLLSLHNKISLTFLPTAIKFHYQFNLRDLTNILSGMMRVKGEHVKGPAQLVQLLMHETARVYQDRMINKVDRDMYEKIANEIINSQLSSVSFTSSKVRPKSGTTVPVQTMNIDMKEVFAPECNVFTNFSLGLNDGQYTQLTEFNKVNALLTEALQQHNDSKAAMNLVLFQDAMLHICKISRIIQTGDALLIGVGGSGKQSLAKLAAFIQGYDVFQITIATGYGVSNFREDLQKLYKLTGVRAQPTMFLFTDTQVTNEEFLVYINDILSSGFVANLFAAEDMDEINNAMRNPCKELGLVDTPENCQTVFIQRVKQNLHVVLGFSPIGDAFKARVRKFPALATCTTIDWFQPWPHDALKSVANQFISDRDKTKDQNLYSDTVIEFQEDMCAKIALFMADANVLVDELSERYAKFNKRYAYTTPKSFLELIDLYLKLLFQNASEINAQINRLELGNSRLEKTEADVSVLKQHLERERENVKIAQEKVNAVMVELKAQSDIVNAERAKANEEQAKTQEKEGQVKAASAEADQQLSAAIPLVEAAIEALNSLDKASMDELSSYSTPPKEVKDVLSAVIKMHYKPGSDAKDIGWDSAKQLMKKTDVFLQSCINFDRDNFHPVNKAAVQRIVSEFPNSFDEKIIQSKSKAAGGLAKWVIAIIAYNDVYLQVKPLREKSEVLNSQLKEAQMQLAVVIAKVNKLNQDLEILQKRFDDAEAERNAVVKKAEEMENQMTLANRLINGLASEKIRWRQSVANFQEKYKTILGDVLLTAAFISYCGPFSRDYRDELLKSWTDKINELQIPIQADFHPLQMLTDESIIAGWNNQSLPTDPVSLQNASIFTSCSRWPLIIDPQLQGKKWIETKEAGNLVIVRLNQTNYLDKIKRALTEGAPVLIENISEKIDAVLNPILAREITTKNRIKYIKLGDDEIEYNDKFKLFIQTKLPNPHYTPEIQAQTTLINFTVTESGLEDQLLADVVGKERADLEKLKTDLMKMMNDFKITLMGLEKDLLNRLSKAGDNIIQDIALIQNLENTKVTSNEIAEKVKQAKITEQEINEAREKYRPVAARSSMLYFQLSSMSVIDHFYQFSLSAFKIVFFNAIKNAEVDEDVQKRVIILIDGITDAVFQYTSRGLFERHRLIFSAQLCFNILRKQNALPQKEFQFLLRGTRSTKRANSIGDFMMNAAWESIVALSELIPEIFEKLPDDIEASVKPWKEWIQNEAPEKCKLPGDWKNKTPLQRLCITRSLRPDRLLIAIREFVSQTIGEKYVSAVPFNFPSIAKELSSYEPLFFILSPGFDPVKDVEALGMKTGYTVENGKFKSVSLGQGQEPNAENAIMNMSKSGGWVLLQNIHLMKSWQVRLEKMMDEYCIPATIGNPNIAPDVKLVHPEFRLFLSGEPASDPKECSVLQGVVQMCIKATNEPPSGIRENMSRAIALFTPEIFEMCTKANEFKQILFGLVFFHAAALERRKFGSIGWNVAYNFTNGDIIICKDVLYNYLEAPGCLKIPWTDLKYMFTEIFYGGHIGDDWDRRFCSSFANDIFNDNLFDDGRMVAPEIPMPQPASYAQYVQFIKDSVPNDNPKMFGLHPNAEITYLTTLSNTLFSMLINLQPADSSQAGGVGMTIEEQVKETVEVIVGQLPAPFDVQLMNERNTDANPYNSVCIQECTRMNALVETMKMGLNELRLGLKGDLTMNDAMETLMRSLHADKIPTIWAKVAYPSLKSLSPWLKDLELRIKQLSDWSNDMSLPKSIWLSGLFNPQSFLRSVLQTTARANMWPLDTMTMQIDITKKELSEITSAPKEGAYIHGLYFDGARWDKKSNSIREAILKDLYPLLPPIYLKAVTVDKAELKDTYECPVYSIKIRNGLSYIWAFNVKTKEPASKWILGGVAILLSNDL